MKKYPKWIGRIDPDGRYALHREKFVDCSDPRKTPPAPKDVWALLVFVPDMLCPHLIGRDKVSRYGCSVPTLPLVVAAYNALSGNAAARRLSGAAPLGLSMSLSQRKRRKRGEKGITAHGKRIVRNGATLLERRYGKDCMAFATLTFPSLSEEDWQIVIENWSKRFNAFLHRLSEYLKRQGLPGDYVGCVEVQEKRHMRTGEPGIHVHLTFKARHKGKAWLLTPKKLRSLWKNVWTKVLKSGYDWNATENLQRVVKSVVNYLAKYLSKGYKSVNLQGSETMKVSVPAWYACSNRLRLTIKANTHKSYAIGEWLRDAVVDDKDMFKWMNFIELEARSGIRYVACYFGQLKSWQAEFSYPEGM